MFNSIYSGSKNWLTARLKFLKTEDIGLVQIDSLEKFSPHIESVTFYAEYNLIGHKLRVTKIDAFVSPPEIVPRPTGWEALI